MTSRHRERQTWWWCEEVQQAIKEKRDAYKRWQRERTEGNKGRYMEKSRLAKRAVAVAKGRAWTNGVKTLKIKIIIILQCRRKTENV